MKDLMMHYGVTNGIRYTKNQKQFFIDEIEKVVTNKKCNFSLQVSGSKKNSITNICIGDFSNAKVILACAYDTPVKKFVTKMDYYPFNDQRNIRENMKRILCRCFVFVVIVMAAYTVYESLSQAGLNESIRIGLLFIPVVIGLFILSDKPNKVNFNRNSASIAICMSLIDLCSAQNRFAISFLDKSVSSHEGLKLLKEKVGDKAEVIILDSIAYGEKLVCAHTEAIACDAIFKNTDNIDFVDKIYTDKCSNVLSYFEKSLVISSGGIKNNQFVVENTQSNNDYQVNIDRCKGICRVIRKYIGGK